jgi:hypothetical protein
MDAVLVPSVLLDFFARRRDHWNIRRSVSALGQLQVCGIVKRKATLGASKTPAP